MVQPSGAGRPPPRRVQPSGLGPARPAQLAARPPQLEARPPKRVQPQLEARPPKRVQPQLEARPPKRVQPQLAARPPKPKRVQPQLAARPPKPKRVQPQLAARPVANTTLSCGRKLRVSTPDLTANTRPRYTHAQRGSTTYIFYRTTPSKRMCPQTKSVCLPQAQSGPNSGAGSF